MGRFFFDLRNGSVLERDELGLELPDVEAAYLEAHRAAIDIWSEACREGRKPDYRCFEIRDSEGRVVVELPFTEALSIGAKSAPANMHPSRITQEPIRSELCSTQRDVTWGKRHVAIQRSRIARLERMGSDTELAQTLLATFLETQRLHEHHCDRLKGKLTGTP
jgi:hypothetical protein